MEQPQRKQNPLETEPIGRLIRRYSIPTALTLMVNYLYNIVDQIFVGQGVGVTGMAATNVAFPLTIVTIALALMIGDGCAANMSLCLGRRQQEEADRTASHTVTLLVAAGVFLAVAGSLFARQIVLLFGATETAFQASLDYTRIIVWGPPLPPSLDRWRPAVCAWSICGGFSRCGFAGPGCVPRRPSRAGFSSWASPVFSRRL